MIIFLFLHLTLLAIIPEYTLTIASAMLNNCCFFSDIQSRLTFCNPMGCSVPDLPVSHHLLEFAQVHVHCISDAIQPFNPLLSSSFSALNTSQHQGLLQWVNFASSDQNTEASASAFPMNIQDWLPLRLIWSPCCLRVSQESSPAQLVVFNKSYFHSFFYYFHCFSFLYN